MSFLPLPISVCVQQQHLLTSCIPMYAYVPDQVHEYLVELWHHAVPQYCMVRYAGHVLVRTCTAEPDKV